VAWVLPDFASLHPGYERKIAATSAAIGIDGAAPIRCTEIDAAALA
jgi:hypothetical protein